MKEYLIASLLTGICIIIIGFTVVISNKETPKAPDEKKSAPDLKYARFDITDSSVEPAPENRIIKNWKLSEKIQKEIKMNYNTSEKGEIIIKKKGVYIIYSRIPFWGRCQHHSYELIMEKNNTSSTIQKCTCNSSLINPDIVPCSIKAEVNVRNKETFHFKVTSDSLVMMIINNCYVEITKKP